MTETELILSKPDRVKQLMRDHATSFPPGFRGLIRLHLADYDYAKFRELEKKLIQMCTKYPQLRDELRAAWEYQCSTYGSLAVVNYHLRKAVQQIRSIKDILPEIDILELISLIVVELPLFFFEGVITHSLYNDDENSFAGLDIIDDYFRQQQHLFLSAVCRVLRKEFTTEDLQTINHTVDMIHACRFEGVTAGIELLQMFMPNTIQYHPEKNLFIDPAVEYSYYPANTWNVGESVTQREMLFGDIDFSERGFDTDELIQDIRCTSGRITESAIFKIPFEMTAPLKEELGLPLSYLTFVESATPKEYTITAAEGKLFLLYRKSPIDTTIYGRSIEHGIPCQDLFEYVIDPEDGKYFIKAIKL